MRKIFEQSEGCYTVKAHYRAEWNEYKATLYCNGKAISTGFESDKEAAIDTAKAMLEDADKHYIVYDIDYSNKG